MKQANRYSPLGPSLLLALVAISVQGCSKKEAAPSPVATQPQLAAAAIDTQGTATGSPDTQLPDVSLTADGLDELLSPIALYPDPVLAVMLQAAQDPQEVMDGGNWLLLDQNKDLKEAALDQASSKAGFTPVMQALLHFGPVVDLMCSQFDWTKQLGAAYKGDPKAVLASVQRLRAQAVDNGALKSSPQLKVDLKQDQGAQIVEISNPDPGTAYIPQYDPAQVYAAPPASTTTVVQPASTTQTVVVQQEDTGVSKGTAALIGLLSFGAGMAVGSAMHHDDYYYPNWGYGGVYYGGRPYYPPPYRPVYGGGWGGGYGYNRPAHYGNNNVYINNSHNNYYNRFNGNNNMKPGYRPQPVHYNNRPGSISSGSYGNRGDAHRGVTANNRPANNNNFRGQSTYQGGNRGGNAGQPNRPGGGNNAGNNAQRPGAGGGNGFKGQSTYQGANKGGGGNFGQQNRPGGGNAGSNAQRPGTGGANQAGARPGGAGNANAGNRAGAGGASGNRGGDRGFGQAQARPAGGNASRPGGGQAAARPQPSARPATAPSGAFGGANNARSDKAASSRGRQSMGAPAKAPGAAQNRGSQGGNRGNQGGARKR